MIQGFEDWMIVRLTNEMLILLLKINKVKCIVHIKNTVGMRGVGTTHYIIPTRTYTTSDFSIHYCTYL